MPELSVIIPVYNVDSYINVCLDSIVNQTFKDMEIIIVNDASTDNTKEIVSEYGKYHSNITIIENRVNLGAGLSRNRGIAAAKGRYIGFIDGDDWVDLNYYSVLMSAVHSLDSDIVLAGITDEYDNHLSAEARYSFDEEFTVDGRTGLRLLTKSENFGAFITPIMNNKVYKNQLLASNRIVCSNNKSWQDDYFSFFAVLYASKITFTPGTTYHYKQRRSSVTHEATNPIDKIDNCLDVLYKIKNRLQANGIYCAYQHEYQSFVERCISSLLSMIHNGSYRDDSEIMCYLFSELTTTFNIGDIIKYLDSERIYRFFNI